MAEEALISHRTTGRLRIKIPRRKGEPAYFDSLERNCEGIPGLVSAKANPLTGSLLLTFSPGCDLSIPDVARKLDIGLRTLVRTTPERKAANQIELISNKVRDFTGGELDLNSLAFLCCLGLGFYQLCIGNVVAPAWYVGFWYAMNLASCDTSGVK